MCFCRWYMLMLLLRDGPLVLMYIDTYSSCKALLLSPYYTEVVNCCGVTCDVTMVINWEGSLKCSLYLSPEVLADSPIHSSSHYTQITLESVNHHTYWVIESLFWEPAGGFCGFSFFKEHLYPIFSTYILRTIAKALGKWHYYVCFFLFQGCVVFFWLLLLLFLFTGLRWELILIFILFRALMEIWVALLVGVALFVEAVGLSTQSFE